MVVADNKGAVNWTSSVHRIIMAYPSVFFKLLTVQKSPPTRTLTEGSNSKQGR